MWNGWGCQPQKDPPLVKGRSFKAKCLKIIRKIGILKILKISNHQQ